jgi:hypothetical protein
MSGLFNRTEVNCQVIRAIPSQSQLVKRQRREGEPHLRVLPAPHKQRQRRWYVSRPAIRGTAALESWTALVAGSSVERLRSQLRWLVAQEFDSLLPEAVSGDYGPWDRPSRATPAKTAEIVDFVAYKKEKEAREAR